MGSHFTPPAPNNPTKIHVLLKTTTELKLKVMSLHFLAAWSFLIFEIQNEITHEVQVVSVLWFEAQQRISVVCQQHSALQGVNQHIETDLIQIEQKDKKRGAMGMAVMGFPTSIPAIFLSDDR